VQGINYVLDRMEAVGTPGSARTFSTEGFAGSEFLQMQTDAAPDVVFGVNGDEYGFGFDDAFMKQVSNTNLDFWQTSEC
jgi:hypothetical protein